VVAAVAAAVAQALETVEDHCGASARQSIKALDSNLERNLEEQLVVVADGSKTATPGKATLTMPRCKIDSVAPAGEGPEFVKTYAFSALETAGNDELNVVLT